MVDEKNIMDRVCVQKYAYLIDLFLSNEITASVFDLCFIRIRRNDEYWLSGELDRRFSKILDTIFLDVDEYAPNELYDPNNKFNIDEVELKKRLEKHLIGLKTILGM